ncbi:hypothetical protein [Haloarcula nitratireducens]|uniref:Transcription factor zinc-finger domain-containing protein n=1 Tax=Haloarcula nitratireducens TaxID=2487749 RepID=A0AAW4P9N3_9EURY|nr:hypothetical protein [Halomicroarcula nitratireducens]MBX0294370.1 hypothetical protein [Halomicroarcula nitratireducens]
MVSEYDLPCSECGDSLVRAEVTTADGSVLVVAECQNCGGRHYPESALRRV